METKEHGLLSPAISQGKNIYNYYIKGTCGHNRYFTSALAYDNALYYWHNNEGKCRKCSRSRAAMDAAFFDADMNGGL